MMVFTVSIGWPHPYLWRNRRRDGIQSYRPFQDQKSEAYYSVRQAIGVIDPPVRVAIELRITPPHNRRFDDSGVFEACKAAFDGIALALGVDDSIFRHSGILRYSPEKPGKVEFVVTIE